MCVAGRTDGGRVARKEEEAGSARLDSTSSLTSLLFSLFPSLRFSSRSYSLTGPSNPLRLSRPREFEKRKQQAAAAANLLPSIRSFFCLTLSSFSPSFLSLDSRLVPRQCRGRGAAGTFRSFGSVFPIDRTNGTLPHPLRSARHSSASLRVLLSEKAVAFSLLLLSFYSVLLFSVHRLGHRVAQLSSPLFSFARSLSLCFSRRAFPPQDVAVHARRPRFFRLPSRTSAQPCLLSLLVTDLRKYEPKDPGVHTSFQPLNFPP